MTPEAAHPEPSFSLDSFGWLALHPKIAIAIGAFCVWISLCLLFNLWLVRRASLLRKLYWSFIVLIPLIGWILYGGFFQIPDNDNHRNDSSTSGADAG